jgi:16S rRNA (adenine1518-N6/adenine1519-N6)-dimethyltransferase
LKHVAKKRFGQHFLTDGGIIDAIVQAINPQPGQPMLEIGPGLGALTQPLVERLGQLTVVELDRDLAERLRKQKNLVVVEDDILNVDIVHIKHALLATDNIVNLDEISTNSSQNTSNSQKLPSFKWRIAGNLPYNISSPILFHLLQFVDHVEDQHFMLQKEVIDRMVARPATAAYGRMSVMLQWRYAMENVLLVPPESFDPPPRVDSAVVRMVPRPNPEPLDPKRLEEIVKVAFSQRRKIMRHTLGKWLADHNFSGEFDVQRRAEEVPVSEYVALAQAV